jgi:hypothetical protein
VVFIAVHKCLLVAEFSVFCRTYWLSSFVICRLGGRQTHSSLSEAVDASCRNTHGRFGIYSGKLQPAHSHVHWVPHLDGEVRRQSRYLV